MIRRIVLVRTDRMGDLLMCLPAVHAVREHFREAEVTLLIQKGLEPLLEDHPDLNRILIWDPGEGTGWRALLRWAFRLRQHRFDAAVILNPSKLFHLATFLAGIPIRIGYRRKAGVFLSSSIPDTKSSRNRHGVEYNLELVHLLGVPVNRSPILTLPRRPETTAEAGEILRRHGVSGPNRPIAIHPWTSNPAKSWPEESFRMTARRLAQLEHTVLVIGGAESIPAMASWRTGMGAYCIDLVGKIPLKILPDLLRQCDLLISNDSGPVHVAAAVGTPTLIVAPKEHEPLLFRWRPWGTGHQILLSPTVDQVLETVRRRSAAGQARGSTSCGS